MLPQAEIKGRARRMRDSGIWEKFLKSILGVGKDVWIVWMMLGFGRKLVDRYMRSKIASGARGGTIV
jgi:hypothetical protein